VLVDSEWVLTAAYCMYPAGVNITSQPANVRVELGCFRNLNNVCSSGTLMLYGQPRQPAIVARQIVVHDQMTVVDGIPQPAYGVALIRLSTPAQTGAGVSVWTVAQSSNNPTAESSPYIVSYGNKGLKATATATRTQTASRTPLIPSRTPTNITRTTTQTRTSTPTAWPEGIATSDVLKASIALINDGSCTLPGFSGATLWCANATAQGNELCYGDTGAPLVSKVSGQLSVFGISLPKVQFGGAHNCVMGMQSAMVDVTAPAIRTWIVNTIRATSPRGLNTSLGGSAGFGGEQLAPSDNDMTQVDVSSVFPSGIRIGTTVTNIVSVNANGVVALGDVKKLDKVINPATYTGAPLFLIYGADADPSLGAITASVGGKSSGANRVWVAKDTVNGVVTITWDDVRPAKLFATQYIGNTFQVQFRRENTSDVRVTYRYGMLQWTFSETMCSQFACMGGGNRVTYAQVGYVSGQARGAGNLMHANSGSDAKLRALVSHEYVVRDGIVGPERPTMTPTGTWTNTRTKTLTRTPTMSMTPTVVSTTQVAATRTHTATATRTTDPLAEVDNPIFIWTGTNSSIPTGWKRVTELDGKFPRVLGNGENNVLATGGSATHSHTSPAHTHGMNWHSHVASFGPNINTSTDRTRNDGEGSVNGHEHASVTTSGPVGATVSWESVQYSPVSNEPPFTEVIFITKSTGSITSVPVNAVALSKTTLGALTLANGANGTIDLQNRFLRGAATGADAGETGGSSVNEHFIDHVHLTSHDHDDQWTGADTTTSTTRSYESGKSDVTRRYHVHMTYYDYANVYTTDTSSISTPETVLPPYTNFVIGQNRTGKALTQKNILALYIGSENNVPTGWVLYTKVGTLIRGSNTTGAQGGSTTHTHGPSEHFHSPLNHSHTGSTSMVTGDRDNNSDGASRTSVRSHNHPVSVSDAWIELSSATTTANVADNMPEYVNVYLIEYTAGVMPTATRTATRTATATTTPTPTITRSITPRPTLGIMSGSTWEFNTLSGDASAASTLANTSTTTTFFCGTNYHATMICPSVSSENGTTFVRFTGTQFMSSQAAISETSNVIRIRLRTSQANDGKVGIYGVVKNFNADSYEAFDRELFFDRGKVCSRLFQGPTDIICTTSRYDDGQWHLIERSYGGSTPAHRLRVDNEVVTGQYTFSAFNWKNGAIIGNSGMFELLTKFRGDIDYVSTGLAP